MKALDIFCSFSCISNIGILESQKGQKDIVLWVDKRISLGWPTHDLKEYSLIAIILKKVLNSILDQIPKEITIDMEPIYKELKK